MIPAWILAALRALGLVAGPGAAMSAAVAWLRRLAAAPATWILVGGLATTVALGAAYRRGEAAATAEARAVAAESRVAVLEFDLAAARRLKEEAETARAADDAETATLLRRISDYEATLSRRPACGFDADDVRLLTAAQGLDPAALDRPPRPAAAAGRSRPGDAAEAGDLADCRAFAARMSAAAKTANGRLARGRRAWERMRALYREGSVGR